MDTHKGKTMKPANFETANCIYRGGDIANDLYTRCYTEDHANIGAVPYVESRWIPSEKERQAIMNGGAVVLTIMGKDVPPLRIEVMSEGVVVDD